jgi:hypothetical protein
LLHQSLRNPTTPDKFSTSTLFFPHPFKWLPATNNKAQVALVLLDIPPVLQIVKVTTPCRVFPFISLWVLESAPTVAPRTVNIKPKMRRRLVKLTRPRNQMTNPTTAQTNATVANIRKALTLSLAMDLSPDSMVMAIQDFQQVFFIRLN